MKFKEVIIISSLLVIFFKGQAQYTNQPNPVTYADRRIAMLVDLHTAYNKEFPVIDGYRIQLDMSSGNTALDDLNEIQANFGKKYPEAKSYIIFREPYYRLRIGDFRTRLEAICFLNRIKNNYPHAWVIKDKIEFPELRTKNPDCHE